MPGEFLVDAGRRGVDEVVFIGDSPSVRNQSPLGAKQRPTRGPWPSAMAVPAPPLTQIPVRDLVTENKLPGLWLLRPEDNASFIPARN
jgi:hypothetical protein